MNKNQDFKLNVRGCPNLGHTTLIWERRILKENVKSIFDVWSILTHFLSKQEDLKILFFTFDYVPNLSMIRCPVPILIN